MKTKPKQKSYKFQYQMLYFKLIYSFLKNKHRRVWEHSLAEIGFSIMLGCLTLHFKTTHASVNMCKPKQTSSPV